MTVHKITMWLAACFLLAAQSTPILAQQDFLSADGFEHDLQFFSPVDLDFENLPMTKNQGWFFGYDKLSWATTGERLTIGSRDTSFGSLNPDLIKHTGGLGVPDPGGPTEGMRITIPVPGTISGINNGPPRAEFAWGERYEFGHRNGKSGWMVGILDGPKAHSSDSYGFGGLGPGGASSVFGSVNVVFTHASGTRDFFRGYLDVENALGIIVIGGDGVHDDIDDDGKHGGQSIIDLVAPGNVPETDVDFTSDFDDLVELPTTFETLGVSNTTEVQGFELMYTFLADNGHRMAKNQNTNIEAALGLRYLRLRDRFRVSGSGGTLGQSFWDTRTTNNLVGPQVALKWMQQRGRVRWDFSGRALLGVNVGNLEQEAGMAMDAVAGQANRLEFMSPTFSNTGRQEQDFSPTVELRAQASYQITSSIAAKLGYNATFIDNIYRAANHVKYELPNMGLRTDVGTQEVFINGINAGFDVVY